MKRIILAIVFLSFLFPATAQKSFGFLYRYDSTLANYKITSVFHNSAAEKGGLLNHDILLEINNTPIHQKKLAEVGPLFTNSSTFKIKRNGNILTYNITKSDLTSDTAFHRKIRAILTYADSSFKPLKGEQLVNLQNPKEAFFDSKIQLTDQERATTLLPNFNGGSENYDVRIKFINTPSKETAESKFYEVFNNLKDAYGIDAYYYNDDSKTGTYYKRYFIGRLLTDGKGYQPYRLLLITEKDKNDSYQVTLFMYGGVKPVVYKLTTDSARADKKFRSMLQYYVGNVYNDKVDNLMGEEEKSEFSLSPTYKTKYCFEGAASCKINTFSSGIINPKLHKWVEVKWPSVKGKEAALKLFNTLTTNIYHSLNNNFVYYIDQNKTEKLLYNTTYVFAGDNKVMPDDKHKIKLREQHSKSTDEYTYTIIIE